MDNREIAGIQDPAADPEGRHLAVTNRNIGENQSAVLRYGKNTGCISPTERNLVAAINAGNVCRYLHRCYDDCYRIRSTVKGNLTTCLECLIQRSLSTTSRFSDPHNICRCYFQRGWQRKRDKRECKEITQNREERVANAGMDTGNSRTRESAAPVRSVHEWFLCR